MKSWVLRKQPRRLPATPSTERTRGSNAGGLAVTVAALVVFGLVMVMSSSAVASMEKGQGAFGIFTRQLLFAIFGSLLMWRLSGIDYRSLRKLAFPFLAVVSLLLVLVLVPGIGVEAGGASRWIGWGSIGVQPSEFAKLAFVLYAASVLTQRERVPTSTKDFLFPTAPVMAVLTGLIMAQPDLGTTVALGIVFFVVLWAAGIPLRSLSWLVGTACGAFVALALSADYRKTRLFSFVDPWSSADSAGYHAIQSMLAIGSGGWTGVGLGAGRQKWLFLPNAHTDFVFAVIGEELGFVGCVAVILLFCAFALFGVRTALRAPDRFGRVLAASITGWISIQAFVNIGVTSGRLPVTGVPLPFISTGGSALLTVLSACGILLAIARQGDRAASGEIGGCAVKARSTGSNAQSRSSTERP